MAWDAVTLECIGSKLSGNGGREAGEVEWKQLGMERVVCRAGDGVERDDSKQMAKITKKKKRQRHRILRSNDF